MTTRILETTLQTAKDLHHAGLMGTRTMREFGALRLGPVKFMSAAEIRRLRRRNGVSQRALAAYLNTSPSTVRKWERGQQMPSGPSLKLLNLVERKGLDVLG
jgi:putative transcriptional regulator